MSDSRLRQPPPVDERSTQRLLISAGTAFGLVYGLSFALMTWAYDAVVLSSLSADLAWGKLAVGLPLALVICVLVGRRGASTSDFVRFLGLWPLANGALGAIAAHVVLSGSNVVVWVVDQRFWLLPVFPFGWPDAVRTGFVVLVQVMLGALVGLVQNLATHWAWDRATVSGRMGWRSWLVMLLCIPLALLPALTVNELVHRPLRVPQQAVSDLLHLATSETDAEVEAAGESLRAVQRLREGFSEGYVTHFVGFDPESEAWYSASVDTSFDTGLLMRCLTFGDTVALCQDLSMQLTGWMGELIDAGLTGARQWEEIERPYLIVDDSVVAWLAVHQPRLSQDYTVSRLAQRGGWILMSAQFDNGFQMGCYFRGARPVVVDHCTETRFAQGR